MESGALFLGLALVFGLRAKCDDLAVKFCAQPAKLVSEQ